MNLKNIIKSSLNESQVEKNVEIGLKNMKIIIDDLEKQFKKYKDGEISPQTMEDFDDNVFDLKEQHSRIQNSLQVILKRMEKDLFD